MGVDGRYIIESPIEYGGKTHWIGECYVRMDRNTLWFGLIAGVRGGRALFEHGYGVPADASDLTKERYDDDHDLHSITTLDIEEIDACMNRYIDMLAAERAEEEDAGFEPDPEYGPPAITKCMERLRMLHETYPYRSRVIFAFDG